MSMDKIVSDLIGYQDLDVVLSDVRNEIEHMSGEQAFIWVGDLVGRMKEFLPVEPSVTGPWRDVQILDASIPGSDESTWIKLFAHHRPGSCVVFGSTGSEDREIVAAELAEILRDQGVMNLEVTIMGALYHGREDRKKGMLEYQTENALNQLLAASTDTGVTRAEVRFDLLNGAMTQEAWYKSVVSRISKYKSCLTNE